MFDGDVTMTRQLLVVVSPVWPQQSLGLLLTAPTSNQNPTGPGGPEPRLRCRGADQSQSSTQQRACHHFLGEEFAN